MNPERSRRLQFVNVLLYLALAIGSWVRYAMHANAFHLTMALLFNVAAIVAYLTWRQQPKPV